MISWIIDENDYYFILGSMLTDKTLLSYWCDFEKTVIQGKYCSLQRKKNMNKSAIKTQKNHGINFVHILLFKPTQSALGQCWPGTTVFPWNSWNIPMQN